ncbi:hypothetical protein [Paraburkholderia tropica]|uniref:hypothetical protein n=1 Tax=Paraburkholderia tropica TaxID=92647 RepID=UPI0015917E63|nr:hypothetical protein [Paraburkholderia tropica]
MARGNLRDELHRQVERTLEAGAVLKAGGHAIEGAGFFYRTSEHNRSQAVVPALRGVRQLWSACCHDNGSGVSPRREAA